MKVICEGYNKCGSYKCGHKKIHEHGSQYVTCNGECCIETPYCCTNKAYIIYTRKEKLKILIENQKDISPEFQDIVNKNFWDLI